MLLADPEEACCCAARSRRSCGAGRGIRDAHGHVMVTGKLAAALRRLGFDRVFDTDWAADLTIMEEASELIGRLKNGGALPMITSCSPGWIKYCEHYQTDFIPNLIYLQVAPRDGRRDDQELLRRKDGH